MKLEKLESITIDTGDFEEAGYLAIKIDDLALNAPSPFNIYAPVLDLVTRSASMARIFFAGEIYDEPHKACLQSKGALILYIREEDEEPFGNYKLEGIRKAFASDSARSEEKAKLLCDHAEYLLKKAFSDTPSSSVFAQSAKLMRTAAVHFSAESLASDQIVSIFAKDYSTFTHSVQVSFLAMAFCTYLGWPKPEVSDVGIGALFHDIGMGSVDRDIFDKPGKLEPDELEMIRKHPFIGYEQLKDSELFSDSQLKIVLQHHEDYGGGGYPSGIEKEQIHRYARIVRIVDCFDILTTRRSRKEALNPVQALKIMHGELHGCFDPLYLDAFSKFFRSDDRGSFITSEVKGLSIALGDYLQIQFGRSEKRFNVKLVGMEPGSYLIGQLPSKMDDSISGGNQATVRYLSSQSGTIYGFQSIIMGFIVNPIRILILSYPNVVEKHELRKHKRLNCFIAATAKIGDREYNGVITDLSLGGCRFILNMKAAESFPKLKAEEKITLRSQIPIQPGVQTLGGIVRSRVEDVEKSSLGIQFRGLPPDATEALRDLIGKLANDAMPL